MTKSVEIKITACAEGVTTVIKIDGELVSNRAVVPTEHGCRGTKAGDLFTDLEDEHPELAEVLEERLSFFDMELLKWFLEYGEEEAERAIHPHAFRNNDGGFTDGNDRKVVAGDRVEYRFEDHRRGILDEALQDGDAFVTWDDGAPGTVKWCHLAKIPAGE